MSGKEKDWEGALGALIEKSDPEALAKEKEKVEHELANKIITPMPLGVPVLPVSTERVSALEYEVSGLRNEIQKLTSLVAAHTEDDKEEEGWRDVYRFHQPEIKGSGVKVTTAIPGSGGHVYEKGFGLQIRDIEGEAPRLRVKRILVGKKK